MGTRYLFGATGGDHDTENYSACSESGWIRARALWMNGRGRCSRKPSRGQAPTGLEAGQLSRTRGNSGHLIAGLCLFIGVFRGLVHAVPPPPPSTRPTSPRRPPGRTRAPLLRPTTGTARPRLSRTRPVTSPPTATTGKGDGSRRPTPTPGSPRPVTTPQDTRSRSRTLPVPRPPTRSTAPGG
jgi:hypothetical protein